MSFKPQHSARWSLAIRTNFVSFVRKFVIRNDCIYLSLVTLNLFQGLYNIFTGIPRLRYRMFTARCLGLFGISQKRGFAQPYGLGHFVTSTLPKIRLNDFPNCHSEGVQRPKNPSEHAEPLVYGLPH